MKGKKLVRWFFAPNSYLLFFYRVLGASGGMLKWPRFTKAVHEMLENKIDSPYLLAFLVDYYEEELERETKAKFLQQALEVRDLAMNA